VTTKSSNSSELKLVTVDRYSTAALFYSNASALLQSLSSCSPAVENTLALQKYSGCKEPTTLIFTAPAEALIFDIVIPLIEMCGCDWFKSRHVV